MDNILPTLVIRLFFSNYFLKIQNFFFMIYNIQFVIICWAEVKTARKSAYNLFAPPSAKCFRVVIYQIIVCRNNLRIKEAQDTIKYTHIDYLIKVNISSGLTIA